jgi:hypothetical protein
MKKADNFDASKWLVENKITFQSRLNEGSDTYPFQADPETIALYDKIASKLEGTISMVASKLEIPESDIRISLNYLWDDLQGNKNKKKGMFIQVKTDDAKWDKAWTGNALIMQTTNDEGIVIPSDPFFGVYIKGNKNPKVRAIYNKALDLDLESLAASENAKIADLVSPEEMKLIAPNTPIVVTGKSNLNEDEGKLKNDLLSLITNNQAKVAKEIGAVRLEDIMIDDLEDVGATAIFDDDEGDEMRGGVAFRYSEDVDDDFEGENGDEPRPIEVAGKELMYISYNI